MKTKHSQIVILVTILTTIYFNMIPSVSFCFTDQKQSNSLNVFNKNDSLELADQSSTKSNKKQYEMVEIRLDLSGKWDLNRENKLLIRAQGVQSQVLLIVDFSPIFPDEFVGAKPNIQNVSFIEGVPIVRQIDSDGTYELTFKSTSFKLSRWFGQSKPEFDGWKIKVYLASGIHVQSLPVAGVKRLGNKMRLKPSQVLPEFSIISSFQNNSWTKYILPTKVHFIDQSAGGIFLWVSDGSVIAKTNVLLDRKLRPAPKIQPDF